MRTRRIPVPRTEPDEPTPPPSAPEPRVLVAPQPRVGLAALELTALVVGSALVLVASLLLVAWTIPDALDWLDTRVAPLAAPLKMPRLPERSTIYAADGSVGSGVPGLRPSGRSPGPHQPGHAAAVLAVEDHAFYHHGALDLESIIRAALVDLEQGRIVQGGSTITQQLAKDLFTGSEVSLRRTLEEAGYAIRLTRSYSKPRILAAYLNEVFLGHSVYGVTAAAEYYFGVPVQELTLSRSALLAGMIASPGRFDPMAHPNRALARRNYVLGRMRALGWIRDHHFERAVATPLRLSDGMRDLVGPAPTPGGPSS